MNVEHLGRKCATLAAVIIVAFVCGWSATGLTGGFVMALALGTGCAIRGRLATRPPAGPGESRPFTEGSCHETSGAGARRSRAYQRLNFLELGRESVARDFEVVASLEVEPESFGGPEAPSEPQRGVGADAPLAVNDLVDPSRRNSDRHRQRLMGTACLRPGVGPDPVGLILRGLLCKSVCADEP
jgi:hypothetical protein